MKHYIPLCQLLFLPFLALAQAGNPDSTFGTNGRKTIPFGADFYGRSLEKADLAYKVNDTILYYAYCMETAGQGAVMAVVKMNADGRPYSDFGQNGTATVQFGSLIDSRPTWLSVVEGKLFVGGSAGPDMGIACLKTDGTLDTSWNHTGRVTVDFGGTDEFVAGMNIYFTNPRTYFVAGTSDSTNWAIARFRLNGALDPSFSADGKHTLSIGKGRMVAARISSGGSFADLIGYSKRTDTSWFNFTYIRMNLGNQVTQTLRARLTSGHNICHAATFDQFGQLFMAGECRDAAGGNSQGGVLSVIANNPPQIFPRFGTAGRTLWGVPGKDVAFHTILSRPSTGSMNYYVGGNTRQGATEEAFVMKLDKFGYADPLFGTRGYRMLSFGQSRERIHEIVLMGGARSGERILGIGPGPNGSLLWSKTKNNNFMKVQPGWFQVASPVSTNFLSIDDLGNNVNYIIGDSGKMYFFYDAEDFVNPNLPIFSWHMVQSPAYAAKTRLRSFKTSASPGDYWCVGDTGFLMQAGSDAATNAWGRRRLPTKQNLNSISSTGSGIAYIVGDSGLFLNCTQGGQNIQKVYTGTRQRLNQGAGASLFVGDSGIMIRRPSPGVWVRDTSLTTQNLYGIGGSPTATIVVGANGTILRGTAAGWTKVTTPFTQDLYSCDGRSNSIYICGAGGLILKSVDNGLTWRQQPTPTTENLRSIVSDGIQTATAVGDNGTLLRSLFGGTFVATQPDAGLPVLSFDLYPNPASRSVSLQFNMERPGAAQARILDLAGRSLQVLFDEETGAGTFVHTSTLELPPGCYLVRLASGGRHSTQKFIVQ